MTAAAFRFAKNLGKCDCAAVAWANILKWAGHRVSYKRDIYPHFINSPFKDVGIPEPRMLKILKSSEYKFKLTSVVRQLTIRDMREALNDNTIIALGTHVRNRSHISIILKITSKYLITVNYNDKTIQKHLISKFERLYLNKKSIGYIIKKAVET